MRQFMLRRALWTVACLLLMPAATGAQVVEYYHLDALGSVRAVTDSAGNVIERHDYLPFGEECTTPPCGTSGASADPAADAGIGLALGGPRRFTAKERDSETGLDYFQQRYYGATLGRFTTTDPSVNMKKSLVEPQRWNRYAYSSNNPLRYVDPDGREQAVIVNGQTYMGGVDGMSAGNTAARNAVFSVLVGATTAVAGGFAVAGSIEALAVEVQLATGTPQGQAALGEIAEALTPGAPPGSFRRIVVDPEVHPGSVRHLEDAGVLGQPRQVNRAGARANRADALRGKERVSGMDLDEAPPAFLRRPGEPASVRPLAPCDNRGCGASMGNQARGVPEGGWVVIVPKDKP